MPKLTEPQIAGRLVEARNWDRLGDMLVRTWQFPTSRRALEFVNRAAAIAERADHHPDINLNYRSVRIELSTHADGGLTEQDFALATELNALSTDH